MTTKTLTTIYVVTTILIKNNVKLRRKYFSVVLCNKNNEDAFTNGSIVRNTVQQLRGEGPDISGG